MDTPANKIAIIKNIYLYLVSFVALMMIVFSISSLINVILKTYIFKQAGNYGYGPTKDGCLSMVAPDGKPLMTREQCEFQEKDAIQQQEIGRAHV